MPNPNVIKYSTATQSGALKKGNFYIGATDKDYGPSNITGYYNGVTFSDGYLSYLWDGSQIRYNLSSTDSELKDFLSNKAGIQFETFTSSLLWSMTQSGIITTNKTYENIVTDGLVLNLDASYLPSYPKSGNTLYDLLGSNNGALTNGPTFNSENGGSIVFDGVDDHVNIGNSSVLTPKFTTFSLWVRFNTFANRPHFGKGEGAFGWVYMVVETSGQFRTYFTLGAGAWSVVYGPTLSINIWYNLTYTYNGSSSTVYVNGLASTPVSAVGELRSNYTTNPFYLGRITTAVNFTGRITTAMVYDRALTSQEVLQNYQSTYTRFTGEDIVTNGIVAHLDATWAGSFTTASNTWTNISGTASNASLINGATYSSTDGGSIYFDGVNDYVVFSSSSTVGREWTMSAWFNCFTQSGGEGIFNVFSANSTEDFYGSGVYVSSLFGTNRSIGWYLDNNWRFTSNNVWQVNTWTHLVATVQGRVHRYYLNGVLVMTYTSISNPPVVLLGSVGRIHNSTRYFPGRISQYLAYNRALTQTEVTQNFNATKVRYGL